MPAIRTQIYLTSRQRARLEQLQRSEGKSMAELVREALDAFLGDSGPSVEEALDETFGALPGLEVPSRDEWDRGYG